MKTILRRELEADPTLYKEVAQVLEKGGLVCHPAPSGYKLVADLGSPDAITALIQAKRRVGNAPSLVFVPDASWVDKVAENVTPEARKLMRAFWPGPVTLLVNANPDLHPKVRKPLTKAKGWLGVRMPGDPLCQSVVRAFGRPLLVSSANLSSKHGAHSLAQVKKNFGNTVTLLIDAGDITPRENSTLVDITSETPTVVRAGAISEERIRETLGR